MAVERRFSILYDRNGRNDRLIEKEKTMKFKAYQRPHRVGWLGWFEDQDGACVGFLGLDNHFVFCHSPK